MPFANLFTRLPVFEENVKSPVQPAHANRKETGNDRRQRGKKSFFEKPRYQTQTTRTDGAFKDDNHQAKRYRSTFHKYPDAGFRNQVLFSHKTDHDSISHKGPISKKKWNVNQTQGQKKRWEQQKHRQERGMRPAHRGGRPQTAGGSDWRNRNEDSEVKHTRFMTQEFKDHNVISVGDRLLCKHFIWGKCIKGDECQLEHVEGYNDLVKESCKFYIAGACFKGESCPYMHKSFPCKFFHRRGKCDQGENCRFSHEPLNELTNKLLDEAIQRENEFIELSKKAEQESSELPENTEATKTPDVLPLLLRPNLYQCVEIKVEEKAPSPQTNELTENSEAAETPQAAHKEPVSYSVEAVLGPQISKPLLSFFTRNQEPAPLHSSDIPTASASNKNHAPYSVEAVLGSFKSTERPPPQTSQTVSYSQKTGLKGSSDPSAETQNAKSRFSAEGNRNEGKKFQKLFQCLPSLQTPSNLTSNSCSDLNLPSEELGRRVGNMKESLKPEVGFEPSDVREPRNLHSDIKHSNGECVDHFGAQHHKTVPSNSSTQTSFSSERPVPSKPHLSVMAPILRTSFKPFTPSSNPPKLKGKATVPAVLISNPVKSNDSADSYPTTQQPVNSDMLHKDTDCKKADGDIMRGCKLKTSFQSLFAEPLTESLQREDASTTSLCPQSLNQSSSPALKSAGLKANSLKTVVQPDKPPAGPFVSLFAAPLPSPQPQGYHSKTSSTLQKPDLKVKAAPCFSDPEQRAANLQTQRHKETNAQTPLRVKDVCPLPASAHFSPDPEKEQKGASVQLTHQACSPVSGSPCEGSAPGVIAETTTRTDRSVPETSSCKEVAGKSILRTLFQHLSPYKPDVEQQDPDQKIQKDPEVSTGRFSETQQPMRKKRRQK